jgi:hypothetical protein
MTSSAISPIRFCDPTCPLHAALKKYNLSFTLHTDCGEVVGVDFCCAPSRSRDCRRRRLTRCDEQGRAIPRKAALQKAVGELVGAFAVAVFR